MISLETEARVARLFTILVQYDKKIEVTKQVLKEQPEFDEKKLYIRMDQMMSGKIGAADIRDFLISRGSDCDLDQAMSFLATYDRDGDAALSVEEFIKALTPFDSPMEPDAISAHAK